MDYNFVQDLISIREILGITQAELAKSTGVRQVTISRNESGDTFPSAKLLERVYSYAFEKNIRLNLLKEMLWTDDLQDGHKLLFHGAKSTIEEAVSVHKGRRNNDFGQGFYCGESYEQAISFISGFKDSCIYLLDFEGQGLNCKKYMVDQEWMMTIAYYRGALRRYEEHPLIKELAEQSRACDYIIAPIADNRMYQIINSFIEGEITDEQCKHCLAATNLGFQYVFISNYAIEHVKLIERCYVCDNEREYYKDRRSADAKLGSDKVKLARVQYRGKGRYIDEILM